MSGPHEIDPEIRRQNQAIRNWYGVAEDWPEPEWLKEFLDPTPWWRRKLESRWIQAAAVIGLALLSAAGGWFVGQDGRGAPTGNPHVAAFLEGHLLKRGAFQSLEPVSADLGWVATLSSLAPLRSVYDVSGEEFLPGGYRIIGAQAVRGGDGVAMPTGTRFVLTSPQGDRAFLYVQGRWPESAQSIVVVEQDGMSLAAWEDGPLAFGLVAERPGKEMQGLAAGIRDIIHERPAPLPMTAPSTASADIPDIPMVR